jgi:molecular chaperone GrpE
MCPFGYHIGSIMQTPEEMLSSDIENPLEDDTLFESSLTDDEDEEVTEEESAFDDRDAQIMNLTTERDQLRDQMLRTLADLQNFRKRSAQDRLDSQRYAKEEILNSLFPVLDNFNRTISSLQNGATVESVLEGVGMVERQLRSVLDQQGLTAIPAVGAYFDPEIHEAIAVVETNEFPDGTIIEELEKGFKLGERVLRPAKVRVTKYPTPAK